MMKNIRYILFLSLVLIAKPINASAQITSDDMLQDMAIPLMDGLGENQDAALLFDSPEGRIISAESSGAVDAQAAFDYYRVVLPSLGWGIEQDNNSGLICESDANYCFRAVRDDETLLLNIKSAEQSVVLIYSLSPN